MATTITANGINFPDGSASAPSIGGTDTNTGLFTGSDIVGFATGGTERLRISSTGLITQTNFNGLGLHLSGGQDPTIRVQDTDGTNQFVDLAHNSGDSYIVTRNNTSHGGFRVYSQNGSETLNRLVITSAGTVQVYPNSSSAGQINLKRGTSTDQETIFYYGSSYLDIETREATGIRLKTNKQDRCTITSDGKVGIGTSSTGYKLEVVDSGGALLKLNTSHEGTYDLRFVYQNSEANIWSYGSTDLTFGTRYNKKLSLSLYFGIQVFY